MSRGRWIGVGVIAVLIAALLVVVGIDLAHAVIGGLVWVVGIILLVHLGLGQTVALPRLPFGRRDGTRTEVSSLSWSLYSTGGVTHQGQQHLRRVCSTGLAEAGIDLSRPDDVTRTRGLLGATMTEFLLDPAAPPPDVRTVRAVVLALEKLEKSG